MKVLIVFIAWCILFVLSWPIALLVLVLAPFVWLVSLPFRVAGLCLSVVFELIRGVLLLPARLVGYRG
jgi:hypothetical protein